jgi:hypothetical protein
MARLARRQPASRPAPLPQHRARSGRPVIPYQRDPWAPPTWLVLTLLAAGLLLAALVDAITR